MLKINDSLVLSYIPSRKELGMLLKPEKEIDLQELGVHIYKILKVNNHLKTQVGPIF